MYRTGYIRVRLLQQYLSSKRYNLNMRFDPNAFIAFAQTRARNIPPTDAYFICAMGLIIALLSLPILRNLDVPELLSAQGLSFFWCSVVFICIAPFALLTMAYALAMLPFHHASAAQLSRYAVIGCFNVALNASIFNLLMLVSGISSGPMVTFFAVITFIIVVTQSFFWSVFWTFKNIPPKNKKRQYFQFFTISSLVAAVNIGIIYFMTSVMGAPAGMSGPLWANIALLCTIFTALVGNFFGYKFFVFAK
jgi:putative flippase GtrA